MLTKKVIAVPHRNIYAAHSPSGSRIVPAFPQINFGPLASTINTNDLINNGQLGVVTTDRSFAQFANLIQRTPIEPIFTQTKLVLTDSVHHASLNRYLEQIRKQHPDIIVSIGTGSPLDWGKLLATHLDIPVIAIPTSLSTNAMFTKWVVIRDGVGDSFAVKTIEGVFPSQIMFDPLLLRQNPRANAAGVGDLLSIYTALYDWDLAIRAGQEKTNPIIYQTTKSILDGMEAILDHVHAQSEEGLRQFMEGLVIASTNINLFGNGRPESGSEHILTNQIDKILSRREGKSYHGELVAISVLVLSMLQDRDYTRIFNMMKAVGMPTTLDRLPIKKAELKEALLTVTPREGRYTWLDTVNLQEKTSEIDTVLSLLFDSGHYFTP